MVKYCGINKMETFNDIIESMESVVNSVLVNEGIFDTPKTTGQWEELKPDTTIIIKGRNLDNNTGALKDTISGTSIKANHSGIELFTKSLSETIIGKDEHGNLQNRVLMSTENSEKYIYFVYSKSDGNKAVAYKDVDLAINPTSPMVLIVNLMFIPAKINDFSDLAINLHETLEAIRKGQLELTPELKKDIEFTRNKIQNIKSNAKLISKLLHYNPLAAPGKRGEITFDGLKQEIANCVCDTATGLLTDYSKEVRYIKPILHRLTKVDVSSIVRIRLPNEPSYIKPSATLSVSDINKIKSQALDTFKQALSYSSDGDYKTTRVSLYIKIPQ